MKLHCILFMGLAPIFGQRSIAILEERVAVLEHRLNEVTSSSASRAWDAIRGVDQRCLPSCDAFPSEYTSVRRSDWGIVEGYSVRMRRNVPHLTVTAFALASTSKDMPLSLAVYDEDRQLIMSTDAVANPNKEVVFRFGIDLQVGKVYSFMLVRKAVYGVVYLSMYDGGPFKQHREFDSVDAYGLTFYADITVNEWRGRFAWPSVYTTQMSGGQRPTVLALDSW